MFLIASFNSPLAKELYLNWVVMIFLFMFSDVLLDGE